MMSYEKAMSEISKRKQIAKQQAYDNQLLAYEKAPRLKQIANELAKTSKDMYTVLFVQKGSIDELKNKNIALQSEREGILLNNGFGADFLSTKHTCATCEDTGFVDGFRCECLNKLINQFESQKFNQSMPIGFSGFDGFKLEYYSQKENNNIENCRAHMKDVRDFCFSYANSFTRNSRSLLMIGATGLGKTHLALAISEMITQKKYSPIYISVSEMIRKMQDEYFGRANSDSMITDSLLSTDLLIIDDLGTELDSNYSNSALYNIINARLNNGQPTIVTSNLSISALGQRYGDRILSRLTTMYTCLKFVGEDIRYLQLTSE